MKEALISAVVAAIVTAAVVYGLGGRNATTRPFSTPPAPASPGQPASSDAAADRSVASARFRISDALPEDVWINGARTPGDDHRSLTDADNSICFITKIELSGIQSPDDTSSCAMQIDEFTGYWDLVATVEEGGKSSVRCNARCLVWE